MGARFEFPGEQAKALFDNLPAIVVARESSDQASVFAGLSIDLNERFRSEGQGRHSSRSISLILC